MASPSDFPDAPLRGVFMYGGWLVPNKQNPHSPACLPDSSRFEPDLCIRARVRRRFGCLECPPAPPALRMCVPQGPEHSVARELECPFAPFGPFGPLALCRCRYDDFNATFLTSTIDTMVSAVDYCRC